MQCIEFAPYKTLQLTRQYAAPEVLCLFMWRKSDIFVWAVVLLTLLGCREPVNVEEGLASYYADSFHGRKTASGDTYSKRAYTAAHRTLAFDTRVRVTNLDNDKSVWVRINDRGPHVEGRIIDLSGAAARKLGITETGTAKVRLEVYD
jgi:rare lipoprotein A